MIFSSSQIHSRLGPVVVIIVTLIHRPRLKWDVFVKKSAHRQTPNRPIQKPLKWHFEKKDLNYSEELFFCEILVMSLSVNSKIFIGEFFLLF